MNAEVYLYGTITEVGGKDKSIIQLDTREYGLVSISSDIQFLKSLKENPLYKKFGVRVMGQQTLTTGGIDLSSLELISIQNYRPKFDESYLDGLIAKASKSWASVDVDAFLSDMREGCL